MKVVLVEDESMVAMLLEDMLADLGHEVIATAGRLGRARECASHAEAELAVIDVNLNGEQTYEVAQTLLDRGIPVILSTGYGPAGLDPKWRGLPLLQKPFELSALEGAIRAALQGNSS